MFDIIKKIWSSKKKAFGKIVYNVDLEFFGPARIISHVELTERDIIEWERDKRKPQNLIVYKMGVSS